MASWTPVLPVDRPSKHCPPLCPEVLLYTMELVGNHRGSVLPPGKSGFGVQSSRDCPVHRNQVGGQGLFPEALILCNTGGLRCFSSHCVQHPTNSLGEPQGRPGQVLNYLSPPHRCTRYTAEAHVTCLRAGGSARDFL